MPIATLVLFSVINTLNYFDRYLLAAVIPLVAADFALSNEESGWLSSSFVIGYVVFSPIFGFLGDRKSRPALMALGVFMWSVATLLSGVLSGFIVFFVVRMFVGVGEASFGSIAPGYIKDRIKDPITLNRFFSIFYAAIPVGAALGYVLGGFLAKHYSWQTAFILGGLPGLLLAGAVLAYPEVERSAGSIQPRFNQGLRELRGATILWWTVAGYVLHSFALTGVAFFVVQYGEHVLGFELDKINAYFGAFLLVAGLFGTIIGGNAASRFGKNSASATGTFAKFAGVSALLAAPLLLISFTVSDKSDFLVLCFLTEFFAFVSIAPINAIIVTTCPPRLVTLTQGISILLINVFGALPGPVLVGKIADIFSLQSGLQLLALPLTLAGLCWLYAAYLSFRKDALRD